MWSLGGPAGAGCSIPAITGGGAGRGWAGKGLWVAMDWFGRSVGGETSPVGGAPAARGYRPPRLAKPARGTSGGGLSWPVSYWGARGGVGEGRAASRSSGSGARPGGGHGGSSGMMLAPVGRLRPL
jgi:hypothetical protein